MSAEQRTEVRDLGNWRVTFAGSDAAGWKIVEYTPTTTIRQRSTPARPGPQFPSGMRMPNQNPQPISLRDDPEVSPLTFRSIDEGEEQFRKLAHLKGW
jgi:hypothetical protein